MTIILYIIIAAFLLAAMIVSSIITVRIVREKGHDTSLWGLFGFFGGALAVIAAACMKDKNAPQEVFLVSEDELTARRNREQVRFEQMNRKSDMDGSGLQNIVCPVCGETFEVDRVAYEVECPKCGKRLKRKS